MQAMPCPIAREIGELLNLSPGTGDNRTGTSLDTAATGTGSGSGGAGGGRRREDRSSPGNRWLHDVMEVAETMKAERVEIILDEKVIYCGVVGLRCVSFFFSPRVILRAEQKRATAGAANHRPLAHAML